MITNLIISISLRNESGDVIESAEFVKDFELDFLLRKEDKINFKDLDVMLEVTDSFIELPSKIAVAFLEEEIAHDKTTYLDLLEWYKQHGWANSKNRS
jgi:hypothetical protein